MGGVRARGRIRSNNGGIVEEFFEEFAGAVLGGPVADVGEVEVGGGLDGEDILYVFDVFGALAAFGPSKFRDDDVLGTGEWKLISVELSHSAAAEALEIVGIVADKKEFDFEQGINVTGDIARGHCDGFESKLRIKFEIGSQFLDQFANGMRFQLHDEISILRGAFYAVDIA